ncbi:MAG: phage tail tape measure protein [Prevotella sp.]|nr:phage tail tape measure protein [Alistipes senegalensis]MCM1357136.1 phage tail tape measure protein [Prevotella sp.]MCM1472647.1 phage tail tape measure protein [Muribaculaceae bacterium]
MAEEVFRLQAAVELNLNEFEKELNTAKRGFASIFDNLKVRTPAPEVTAPDGTPIKKFTDETKSNVANMTENVGTSIKQLPSKIGESFKNVAGTVGGFLAEIPEKVSGIFSDTVGILQNIAAKVTTTGVNFLKESVNAGADFDKSMAQVAATMGKSVEDVGGLRDFALEMGNSTAFSATEAADALNYMALAGYDAETSVSMLPNVLNLASAGGISLANASDMVTDSQSALGLSLDETAELVDKMAAASSSSNTSVAQLGDAILTVGGTAKKLKGGTTELATVLGILADNGIKGSEGGTALRNMLNSLISPTTEAAELLDSMGISLYDEAGNMRSLNDVFLDLRGGMESLATQAERDQILTTIFNARDLKSAEALLSNVGTRYEDLSRKIADSDGAAKKMADTQLDNLAGDITLFQSALEGVKISLSDKVTPALRDAVQIGTKGLERVTIALKSADFGTAMQRLSKLIQPTIDDIIKRITDYVPKIVKIVYSLVQAFKQSLLKNTPIIAESALKLVLEFAEGISRNAGSAVEEFSEILGKIVDFLKNSYHQLVYAGIDMAISIISGFRSKGEEISRNIAEILTIAADAISTVLPFFVSGIAEIVGILGGALIQALPEISDSTAKIIERIGNTLIESLPELFAAANEIISFISSSMTDNLPQILTVALEIIVQIATGIIDSLPLLVESAVNIIESLSRFIAENLPSLVPTVTGIIIKIIDVLTNPSTLGDLVTAGLSIIVTLAQFIIDSLPELLKEVPKIVESLVTVIVENLPKIVNAAIEIMATLGECLTNPENLRILTDGGKKILQSLIGGIKSVFSELAEVAGGIIGEIRANVGDLYDSGVDMIKSFIDGVKDKAKDLIEEIKHLASGIAQYIGFSEPDKGPLSNFHTFAPDMINLFTKGIKDNKKSIIDETKSIATSIKKALNIAPFTPEFADIQSKINVSTEIIDSNQLSDILPESVAEIPVNFDVGKIDANQLDDVLSKFVAKIPAELDVETKIDSSQISDIQSILLPCFVSADESHEYVVRSNYDRYYAENSQTTTVENLNITLESGFRLSSDYDTERFINTVAERLQARQMRINRGTGGVQF